MLDRERVETIRLGLIVEDLAAISGMQTASGISHFITWRYELCNSDIKFISVPFKF